MTTFSDLQFEVLLQLEGFANDQAVIAKVQTGITSGDTTIVASGASFSDGSGLSPGVWEIEEELVYVPDYNRSTATASNVVRGWRGTTAASHSAGATIRNAPRYPMIQVKRAINDTVQALFPRVPAIKNYDFTLEMTRTRYQLPADARGVLAVSMKDIYSEYAWVPIRRWMFDPQPGDDLEGFKAINIPEPLRAATVRVLYTAEGTPMSGASDNFETVTGLPSFAREAVVWGAMWRLYSMVELGRGAFTSADQTMMNRNSDYGKATDIAKYLLAMHQQAVADAESKVQDMYPAQKHYVW